MTEKLTRKEICTDAANERWNPTIPKATHSGVLYIADLEIACDVLEDGTRVLRSQTFLKSLGRSRPNQEARQRAQLENLPIFLMANNLTPYLKDEFRLGASEIIYKSSNGKKLIGYRANILIETCEIYLKAREDGVLTRDQAHIAHSCEVMTRAFAKIGLIALIDEVTCYQQFRERNALQELLDKFIDKELQPWTRRFPEEFFNNMKKMYGLQDLKRMPAFAGHLINRYIYNEISSEVLEELKKKNPVLEHGRRKHAHHRLLTLDLGCPALEKQVIKINTLMSVSENKEDFDKYFEKSKSR